MVIFRFDLEKEEDGRWLASLGEFPGITKYGVTRVEAIDTCLGLALKVFQDKLQHRELELSYRYESDRDHAESCEVTIHSH